MAISKINTNSIAAGASPTMTDLTLSGGVYLGGTGAANYLDDYEEGTWTLTLGLTLNVTSVSASNLDYVKAGKMVMLTGRLNFNVTSTGVRTLIIMTAPINAEDSNTVFGGGGLIEGPSPSLGIAGGIADQSGGTANTFYMSFIPVATGAHFYDFSCMYKSA